MALTAPEFVSRLSSGVPESSTILREHLAGQEGELLLHLLVGDLRRLALAWFEEGRADALARLLDVLDTALREGDKYVENAIAVSFVEDLGWWEADMQPFITTLPGDLANEVERPALLPVTYALIGTTALRHERASPSARFAAEGDVRQ